jgi:hypothetical protein
VASGHFEGLTSCLRVGRFRLRCCHDDRRRSRKLDRKHSIRSTSVIDESPEENLQVGNQARRLAIHKPAP